MDNKVKREKVKFLIAGVLLSALMCFLFFSCERNPTKLRLDRYNVWGWVYMSGSTPPEKISDAQVSIGATTVTSNDSGFYVLTDIPVGQQTIQVSKSGYESSLVTVDVEGDIHRDLYLLAEGTLTTRVYGVVRNSLENAVEEAYVFIDGPSTLTTPQGYYDLDKVVQGTRLVRVTRSGYLKFEQELDVTGVSLEFNVPMVADSLPPPQNVSTTVQSRNSVYITWKPYDQKTSPDFPFNTLRGYRVYRYDWAGGNFADISGILASSVGGFSDEDGIDATLTVLKYKVLTVNIDGNDGLPSDSIYAKGYSWEVATEVGKHNAARTMVAIPASEFNMGSSSSGPIHKVILDAFLIDKYEVTNKEFADFLNEVAPDGPEDAKTSGGVPWLDTQADTVQVRYKKTYIPPSDTTWILPADTVITWADTLFQAGVTVYVEPSDTVITWADTVIAWADSTIDWRVDTGSGTHPVIAVTYYGAEEYAKWAGKRLPTEAEWERAARFIDGRSYPWGNEVPTSGYCNYNLIRNFTAPIGSYEDYPSVEGVYDLAGNVWEWCSDWYAIYSAENQINPTGPPTGTYKVLRGGSWRTLSHTGISGSNRGFKTPESSGDFIGFRCAKDLESE